MPEQTHKKEPRFNGRETSVRGYELQGEIGSGAFATVYRAYQPSIGREVAVKVILPKYANQPDFIRRFEAEARIVARLEHPYIVPLFDYWREPAGAYLVMRYLRGGNLRGSMNQGPWPPEKTAHLIDQIAQALALAHRKRVVHRDIKPENILLDADSNAFLTDFGIAKDLLQTHLQTETGALIGSLAYVSPEQALSQPVSSQSDLYSLAVVSYELLAGERPFPGESPAGQLIKHINEPLPSLLDIRPGLPPELDQVIQRAAAKQPAQRYPDVLAFSAAMQAAVAGSPMVAGEIELDQEDLINPYKGLRPFEEADVADFFGREQLVDQLLGRLSEDVPFNRFLAVVGPSGSGKSSVVKAGLIPTLRSGALPGSDGWFVMEMVPGARPLDELEIGLLQVAIKQPPDLMAQLRRDGRGLSRAVRLILPSNSELLLVVDQFEELFAREVDDAEREHFLALLHRSISDPQSQIRIIITLRADFYDRPLLHPDFGQLVMDRTQALLPMNAEEMGQAISEPANLAGAQVKSDLLTQLVTDVSEEPGALPMLQYTLTELFDRRKDRHLTLEVYKAIGGVTGAIAQRAEDIYLQFDPASQDAARQLFLRLITLGEGVEDTRRRVLRSEVVALSIDRWSVTSGQHPVTGSKSSWAQSPSPSLLGPDPQSPASQPPIPTVIDTYGHARLLTFDRDPITREPTVEVAHEALLREWQRLRDWLGESRDDLRQHRMLVAAAAEWSTSNRDPGFLLRGSRLDQFEQLANSSDLALTVNELSYLKTSLSERNTREEVELERQAHEQALERRSRTRLRGLVAVFAVAAIIAVGLTIFALNRQGAAEESAILALQGQATATVAQGEALYQAGTAEAERVRAETEAAARATQQVLAEEQSLARATAQSEAEIQRAISDAERDQTRLTLSRQLAAQAQILADEDLSQALLSAIEGLRVVDTLEARAAMDKLLWANVSLLRMISIRVPATLSIPAGRITKDGEQLLVGWLNVIRGFDLTTGRYWSESVGTHTTSRSPLLLELSGDGQLLAGSGNITGFLAEFDDNPSALSVNQTLFPPMISIIGVRQISLNHNGQILAVLTLDGQLILYDTGTYDQLDKSDVGIGDTAYYPEVIFSPDGDMVATGGLNHSILLFNLDTGQLVGQPLAGHTGDVGPLAFSPDGRLLASGSGQGSLDTTIRLWDTETGESVGPPLSLHNESLSALTFSHDGRLLSSGDVAGDIIIWDTNQGEPFASSVNTQNSVIDLAFWADNKTLSSFSVDLAGSGEMIAHVWDLTLTNPSIHKLEEHRRKVISLAFSPNGQTLTSVDTGGEIINWDVAKQTTIGDPITGPIVGDVLKWFYVSSSNRLKIAPNADTLFELSLDGPVRMQDFQQIDLTFEELRGPSQPLLDLDVNQESNLAVGSGSTGANGALWLWNLDTNELLYFLSEGLGGGGLDVALSHDGQTVAVRDDANNIFLWTVNEKVPFHMGHVIPSTSQDESDRVSKAAMEFNPTDQILAVGGFSGLSLWFLGPDDLVVEQLPGELTSIWSVAFAPDGTKIAAATADGQVAIWDTETLEMIGQPLKEHIGTIFDLEFSPDGQVLASAGADQTITLWDIGVFTEQTNLEEYDIEAAIDRACSIVNRNFTQEEWTRFFGQEPYRLTCPQFPSPEDTTSE